MEAAPLPLPADSHTHSQWSWDARLGAMERSCRRAAELGLPAIAFTEHVDLVHWTLPPAERAAMLARRPERAEWFDAAGRLLLPPLDVDGYLECVERCRHQFPGLRILTGVELGEPHWFTSEVTKLLASGRFERVLGSLHSLTLDNGHVPVDVFFRGRPGGDGEPGELVRTYLAATLALVESAAPFEALAHIDYPVRGWPAVETAFAPEVFEDEFRTVLRALARSGRALEINTRLPLHSRIVHWWREEGGLAVSFGSDAHLPEAIGHGFREAAVLADAAGFQPEPAPEAFWTRARVR